MTQIQKANALPSSIAKVSSQIASRLAEAGQQRVRVESLQEHRDLIQQTAEKYQLSPDLLAGLMLQVSGGDENYTGPRGSQGLMQLSPALAQNLSDPTDPKQNLEAGAKLLRQQLDRFGGDTKKALAAYWFGGGTVAKNGVTPPMQEFVGGVLEQQDFAKSQLGSGSALHNLMQWAGKLSDIDYEKLVEKFVHQNQSAEPSPELKNSGIKKQATSPQAYPSELGSVSAQYESGGRGVSTVSSGKNDPGGVSYGTHQLSSQTVDKQGKVHPGGTMATFLKSPEASVYADHFKGLTPGTPNFSKAYSEVAKQDPKGFAKAQKDFITRTHYEPRIQLAKELGFHTESRGVQEAIYSASVQHGGASKILKHVAADPNFRNLGADDQIRALYAYRTRYAIAASPKNAASFRSRYASELKDALALANAKSPASAQDKASSDNAWGKLGKRVADAAQDVAQGLLGKKAAEPAHGGTLGKSLGRVAGKLAQSIAKGLGSKEIGPVLKSSDFVAQATLPRPKVACYRACVAMLDGAGVDTKKISKSNVIQVALEDSKHTRLNVDLKKSQEGSAYIDSQLASGKPVIIGVNHTLGKPHNEDIPTTDHFVVVVGKGYDAKTGRSYYRFFDPGSQTLGTRDENRLYVQDDGSVSGKGGYNPKLTFTLSQVRKNS